MTSLYYACNCYYDYQRFYIDSSNNMYLNIGSGNLALTSGGSDYGFLKVPADGSNLFSTSYMKLSITYSAIASGDVTEATGTLTSQANTLTSTSSSLTSSTPTAYPVTLNNNAILKVSV